MIRNLSADPVNFHCNRIEYLCTGNVRSQIDHILEPNHCFVNNEPRKRKHASSMVEDVIRMQKANQRVPHRTVTLLAAVFNEW